MVGNECKICEIVRLQIFEKYRTASMDVRCVFYVILPFFILKKIGQRLIAVISVRKSTFDGNDRDIFVNGVWVMSVRSVRL